MRKRRSPVPHDESVEEILWCFDLGMDRAEAAEKLGYAGKSGVEQVIYRERRYASITGKKSRL